MRVARTGVLAVAALALAVAPSAFAACPPVPHAACRLAATSRLRLDNGATDDDDRLEWKWRRGPSTSQSDFGNPTASTAYALCLWDANGIALAADLPAGGVCNGQPCWQSSKSGWSYSDPAGGAAGTRQVMLGGSARNAAKVKWTGRGSALPDWPSLVPPFTIQLLRSDGGPCFESVFTAASVIHNDATQVRARLSAGDAASMPALSSAGCGTSPSAYPPGATTADSLTHDARLRTFRVHVPPTYDVSGDTPVPVVFLLHGGFGSGVQIETDSRLLPVADARGFVVVSPDGVAGPGGVRTWNGGGCCGYAANNDVDDVGFVAAMLDRLETSLCVDRRRVYATGMSNGAILSHRLACDLSGRIRAVASIAGAMMASPCAPLRPVPVMEIHGTGDMNIPYDGGMGCGAAGVPFPSVAETIGGWTTRGGCNTRTTTGFQMGDGTCVEQGSCAAAVDVATCTIPNGGHQWPGGEPPAVSGLPGCPFGYQSQSFSADDALWQFFSDHPQP